jgi:hypothetical protein
MVGGIASVITDVQVLVHYKERDDKWIENKQKDHQVIQTNV